MNFISLVFLRGFPHTRQPLGHARPALCRVRVRLTSVLLDQRPSLLILRQRLPVFVQMIHRYCSAVRLLEGVHAGCTAIAFSRRPATIYGGRCLRGLPVLVQKVSRRVWGLRLRRTVPGLALSPRPHVAFRQSENVGVLIAHFRSSIPSPPIPLFTLHCAPRGTQRKTRGRVDRYSFLVRIFHSLLPAGLSRRSRLRPLGVCDPEGTFSSGATPSRVYSPAPCPSTSGGNRAERILCKGIRPQVAGSGSRPWQFRIF